MANLKELRNRITSVSSTMQITSAMKMVSAAKLNKAQQAITAMRPYADKLTELLQSLSATLEGDNASVYAEEREIKKILVVAIASNRGLAGAFNTNIIKGSRDLYQNQYADKQVDFVTIGKKVNDVISKTHTVVSNRNDVYDDLTFANVAEIAEDLMARFTAGDYDKIVLIYNQFKNAASQDVIVEQFLPISPVKRDENVDSISK